MPLTKLIAEIRRTYYAGAGWLMALDVVAILTWTATSLALGVPRPRHQSPIYWAFLAVAFGYVVLSRMLARYLQRRRKERGPKTKAPGRVHS